MWNPQTFRKSHEAQTLLTLLLPAPPQSPHLVFFFFLLFLTFQVCVCFIRLVIFCEWIICLCKMEQFLDMHRYSWAPLMNVLLYEFSQERNAWLLLVPWTQLTIIHTHIYSFVFLIHFSYIFISLINLFFGWIFLLCCRCYCVMCSFSTVSIIISNVFAPLILQCSVC